MAACALLTRPPIRGVRPTVCIVDDDSDVREVLARVVAKVGFEAERFDSAEAFLRRTAGTPIGCLVLDVELGGMGGLELLERISQGVRKYPILLISGGHNARTRARARRFSATVIDKPFDVHEVGRRIRAAMPRGGLA
jgi:FixJ family two-component response regulator